VKKFSAGDRPLRTPRKELNFSVRHSVWEGILQIVLRNNGNEKQRIENVNESAGGIIHIMKKKEMALFNQLILISVQQA
jgi:hypothetical protein